MSELLSNTERTIEAFFNSLLKTDESLQAPAIKPQPARQPARASTRRVQAQVQAQVPTQSKPVPQPVAPSTPAAPALAVREERDHPRAKPVSDLLKQVYQPKPSALKQAVEKDQGQAPSAPAKPAAAKKIVLAELKPAPKPAVAAPAAGNEELESFEWMLAESGMQKLAGEIIPPQKKTAEPAEDEFQVLYFDVAGLTLAVPLKELGGILDLRQHKITSMGGKPWFQGTLLSRGEQHHVVDTACWVMPEKYTSELAQQIDYQYLIMLKDSPWGLACEKLVTAESLSRDKVQWRQITGRRPWLAGMAIDKMCALLNVDALIDLLDQGAES